VVNFVFLFFLLAQSKIYLTRQALGHGKMVDFDACDQALMDYATWISQIKGQIQTCEATQRRDLLLLTEAVTANGNELNDFKRQSASNQQQIHAQVTELLARFNADPTAHERNKLLEEEIALLRQETKELKQETLELRSIIAGTDVRSRIEALNDATSGLRVRVEDACTQGEMEELRQSVRTELRRIDIALGSFSSRIKSMEHKIPEMEREVVKTADVLGQAIRVLSKDLADFQRRELEVNTSFELKINSLMSHPQFAHDVTQ